MGWKVEINKIFDRFVMSTISNQRMNNVIKDFYYWLEIVEIMKLTLQMIAKAPNGDEGEGTLDTFVRIIDVRKW